MDATVIDHSNGISLVTYADGTVQLRCNDCSRWVHADSGKQIVHSSRCDTPSVQATPTVRTEKTIPQPHSANGLSNQDALDAVQRGYLTSDQAMNRDF